MSPPSFHLVDCLANEAHCCSGPLAPVPGGLGAMGYPYQSYLKKIFAITLISHRTNHKVSVARYLVVTLCGC